jgi:hypothetical protein
LAQYVGQYRGIADPDQVTRCISMDGVLYEETRAQAAAEVDSGPRCEAAGPLPM